MTTGLGPEQPQVINAYWGAANYLSVGRIYLLDNPLLQQPLAAEHVKPRRIHRLIYWRIHHKNLHVRDYQEEGTTTAPFDTVVRNDLDRLPLVVEVVDRVPRLGYLAAYVKQTM